jgi:hypothetical protein
MLVVHLSPEAPIVLAVSDETLSTDDPFAGHWDLINGTYDALGPRRNDVPGPVMLAPFDVVATAAGRDVAADVTSAGAIAVPGDAEQARRYGVFVDMLRDSRAERRVNLALNRLLTVFAVDDLRAAFDELPELAGPEVRARLAEEVPRAQNDEARLIATARVELVRSATEGRFEEAWERYEERLLQLSRQHVGPRVNDLLDQLRAEQRGDAHRAIELGEEVLELFRYAWTQSAAHVEALMLTAAAYFSASGPDIEDRLDRVIALCQRAIDVIDAGLDDPEEQASMSSERARALLNMGAA